MDTIQYTYEGILQIKIYNLLVQYSTVLCKKVQYNNSIGKLLSGTIYCTCSRTTICVAKSPSIMSTCLGVKGNRQQNQPSVMAYKIVFFSFRKYRFEKENLWKIMKKSTEYNSYGIQYSAFDCYRLQHSTIKSQCRSRNCPGFDPSILRHNESEGIRWSSVEWVL